MPGAPPPPLAARIWMADRDNFTAVVPAPAPGGPSSPRGARPARSESSPRSSQAKRPRTGARPRWVSGVPLLCAFAVALALAGAGGAVLGYQPFTVMSGSMQPAIRTGDLVIDEHIAPLEARRGDVVTFVDPTDRRRLITHRVRHLRRQGSRVAFVTKGDANNTVERWSVPVEGRIGRVALRVPKLGYAAAWSRGPYGRLMLVVLPAICLAGIQLHRIWRPAREG